MVESAQRQISNRKEKKQNNFEVKYENGKYIKMQNEWITWKKKTEELEEALRGEYNPGLTKSNTQENSKLKNTRPW